MSPMSGLSLKVNSGGRRDGNDWAKRRSERNVAKFDCERLNVAITRVVSRIYKATVESG